MITESHELLGARFTDNPRTTIEALWIDPKTGEISEEIIEAKVGDDSYEHLLKFIELDDLHETTKNYFREQKAELKKVIKQIAEEENLIFVDEVKEYTGAFSRMNDLLFHPEENQVQKDFLFNLKLSSFELDFVKNYKGRKLKSELRKATSTLEVYKILFAIKDEVDAANEISNRSNDSESNQEIPTQSD